MRTMLMLLLLTTTAYGVDVDTLRAQKDSIENDVAAKAELLSGIKSVMKWAIEGQSSKDARVCVAMTATAMERYWGVDSAALLKKRLNGMISVVNKEVKWLGTPKRFMEVKAELLQEKEDAIEAVLHPKKESQAVAKKQNTRTETAFIKAVLAAKQVRDTALEWPKAYAGALDLSVLPYKWTITAELSGMNSTGKYSIVYLTWGDERIGGNLKYNALPENIDPSWKKGDTVQIMGYFNYTNISNVRVMTEPIWVKNKKTGERKQIVDGVVIRGLDMVSPELANTADAETLKKMHWQPRAYKED